MLGLRPLGSITVSFGAVFFGLWGLVLLGSVISNDPVNMSIVVMLLAVGVVMLYLPLNGVHRKMMDQKQMENKALHDRLRETLANRNDSNKNAIELRLEEIRGLMQVHLDRDEISGIPTWPFDTGLVQRLAAVTIAIITIILARIAQLILKL